GRTGGHLAPGRGPAGTAGAGTSRPPGRGFEPPKDIYALRAQAAGVTGTGAPGTRGPGDKERREGGARPAPGGPPARGRGGHRRKTREQIEQELLSARNNVSKVMASLSRNPVKGR